MTQISCFVVTPSVRVLGSRKYFCTQSDKTSHTYSPGFSHLWYMYCTSQPDERIMPGFALLLLMDQIDQNDPQTVNIFSKGSVMLTFLEQSVLISDLSFGDVSTCHLTAL